jgi:hypothetical protein
MLLLCETLITTQLPILHSPYKTYKALPKSIKRRHIHKLQKAARMSIIASLAKSATTIAMASKDIERKNVRDLGIGSVFTVHQTDGLLLSV